MSHSDVERLTRMVTERARALVLFARQWLDVTSAEDAVQEAFLALLGQKRPPENPVAWTYRAVRNAAIDHLRSAARRRQREQTVALERREMFDSTADALIDSATAQEWLDGLSLEHREVVHRGVGHDAPR